MSYHLKVIRDYPIGFWKLDESSGSTAFDNSGCANNGTYYGGLDSSILPLIPGGASGNLINNTKYITLPTSKNYYASNVGGGLADKNSSDNDFTIEVWVSQNITTSNRTTIFADATEGIGLFYENGNIVFKILDNEIIYTLNNTKKAIYLAATYSVSSMKLFVDGYEVASQQLNSFKFTNTSLLLSIGPTSSINDSFIVDAPAVYRYALSPNKIRDHYIDGISVVNPYQVVISKGGYFFPTNEENLLKAFVYELLPSKMQTLIDANTYYDSNYNFISFYKSDTSESKESFFYDIVNVPVNLGIISSKIEWQADKGVEVFVSEDGINYEPCTNGSFMPFYNKSVIVNPGLLYIKIRLYSSDASKYLPKLSSLKIKFYSDKDLYSQNYGYKISSSYEYSVCSFNYPPLLRFKNDGIQTSQSNGFNISSSNIRTIEFFFTPSSLSATTLISSSGLNLSWNGSGSISKTGISEFYVNGVSKTSTSTISSVFAPGMLYLVTIVTSLPVNSPIEFNLSGPSNMYNNIALYETEFSQVNILDNFNSYISRPAVTSSPESLGLTDSGSSYYDDEYIVIRSV